MRRIDVSDGLRVRFPSRGEEFDQGVEVGVIAALMSMELADFSRWISPHSVGQVRNLADKLGYRIIEGRAEGEWAEVTFQFGRARPAARAKLKLVHSAS